MRNLGRFALTTAGIVGFVASLFAVIAVFSIRLPVNSLFLPCEFIYEDEPIETQKAKFSTHVHEVKKLSKWASEFNGEAVYVSLTVAAGNENNVPCDIPTFEKNFNLGFWFGKPEDTHENITTSTLNAYDPSRAPAHSILSLPTFDENSSPLHTSDKTGALISIEGPFVVNYQSIGGSPGIEVTSFVPFDDSSSLWQEIGCAKRRLNYPQWLRAFIPCF